ncbi:MAG: hypothetical protein E6I50_04850 [Chloroflexi bacterium]|nr:MAG: hypothetical protein E6I50_04850 [Chloroflexota bacterium]
MALTQKKLQDLKDASLTGLLQDDPAAWKAKAKHAYTATHGFIKEIRPDDVVPLLIAELATMPILLIIDRTGYVGRLEVDDEAIGARQPGSSFPQRNCRARANE